MVHISRSGRPTTIKLKNIIKAHTTHGLSHHPLYKVWEGMKQRCNNPDGESYKNYGGRGIKYNPEWEDFEVFFVDVIKGYKKGLQLDRYPNNNGDYDYNNFRWATPKQQMRNIRTNRIIKHNGLELTMAEWAESLGIEYNRFYGYVYRHSFVFAYNKFSQGYIWKYA